MSLDAEPEHLAVGGQLENVMKEGEDGSHDHSKHGGNNPPIRLEQLQPESSEEAPESPARWSMLEDEGREKTGSLGPSSPFAKQEEPARPMSEEDVLREEAAKWIQRTVRGHASRRLAQYTMIWPLYPTPVGQHVWGYQGFWHIKGVVVLQEEYDFRERLDLLNEVLQDGLKQLPHHFSKDIGRPLARRKARGQFLHELLQFCMFLAAAYWNEGQSSPAYFLWSSVVTLCAMPPVIDDVSASRKPDRCHFKEKLAIHICALDYVAMLSYRHHDYQTALEHVEKGLDLCMNRTAGRLPYCVLSAHKALILAGQQQNERAQILLEEIIPVLSTVEENPMGEIELLEARKIVSHVLLTCCHNFAVQLRVLGKQEESQQAAENSFVMSAKACHSAQPVSRVILHAYTGSLRPTPLQHRASQHGYGAAPDESFERTSSAGSRMLAITQLVGTGKTSQKVPPRPDSGGPEKDWRKWLAITLRDSPYVAPLWLDIPTPALNLDESAKLTFDEHFSTAKTAATIIDAVKLATRARRHPSQEAPPLDVVEAASKSVLRLCSESRALLEQGDAEAAGAKVEEVQTLMTRSAVPFADALPWWLRAHATLRVASFLYHSLRDYPAAAVAADQAQAICEAHGGGHLGALAGLAAAAVQIREGRHDKAFANAQRALRWCKESAGAESPLQPDPREARIREDVLVAASHGMALAHLFWGNSKLALRLSRTATEHLPLSNHGDHDKIHFLQVSRVYELSLSASEMVDKRTLPFVPSERPSWQPPAPSKLHPAAFVPSAVRRNLPAGYMAYVEGMRARLQGGGDGSGYRVEGIVQQQLDASEEEGPPSEKRGQRGGEGEGGRGRRSELPAVRGKRYKWSGSYTQAAGPGGELAETDQGAGEEAEGQGLRERSLRASAAAASRGPGAALTPYGEITLTVSQVAASGTIPRHAGSVTGSDWADELLSGRGSESKTRGAEDERAKLYFAQVFKSARDQVYELADPLEGSRARPLRVGGRGAEARRGEAAAGREGRIDYSLRESGGALRSAEEASVLRRSWAVDPTSDLLGASRRRAADEMQRLRGGARSSTPSMSDSARGSKGERAARGAGARRGSGLTGEKMDWVNLRLEKHTPFDTAIRRSALGLFYSPKDRQELLAAMEEHSQRPLSKHGWSTPSSRDTPPPRTLSSQNEAHLRPFYWSHRPDRSHYLHTLEGRSTCAKANPAYRAQPYGKQLSPAAKQAYGTTDAPILGPRSLQTMQVDPVVISNSVELGDATVVPPSQARSLTGFY